MCAEAVVAQIAFRDSKTNLFLDFVVESSCVERAAKVEVGFKGCRCVTEHAEKVRHEAEFGPHLVEHLLRLAGSALGIQRWNSIPVLRSAHLFRALQRNGSHSDKHTPCQATMAAELARDKA